MREHVDPRAKQRAIERRRLMTGRSLCPIRRLVPRASADFDRVRLVTERVEADGATQPRRGRGVAEGVGVHVRTLPAADSGRQLTLRLDPWRVQFERQSHRRNERTPFRVSDRNSWSVLALGSAAPLRAGSRARRLIRGELWLTALGWYREVGYSFPSDESEP